MACCNKNELIPIPALFIAFRFTSNFNLLSTLTKFTCVPFFPKPFCSVTISTGFPAYLERMVSIGMEQL